MGIKKLYDVISKHAPEAIGRVPITFYKGKKIAIDAHNWMFMNMYGARKISARKTNFAVDKVDNTITRQEWVKLCVNFVIKWLNYGIIPIFVFDGTHKPEKGETQKKRCEEFKKKRDEHNNILEQINNIDPLDRTLEVIKEAEDSYTKFIDLNKDEIDNLINILDNIGLPWYQALGESEQLCSMLALENKVDAVFSRDGDNIALGCPVLLKEYSTSVYENGRPIPTFEYYQVDKILTALKLNMDEFVDLCILLGCDYNDGIKGIGPVRAYNLILEHRSIKSIERNTGMDISSLNYKKSRLNFKKIDSSAIILNGRYDMKEPDFLTTRDVLETNGIAIITRQLCSAMAECYEIHYVTPEINKLTIKEKPDKNKKRIKIVRIKKDNGSG